ncbi:MAG: TonB-dependent receptor [Bacteroidales bacterium]|nr:TonB-dependent receptor [Bacteroidales bacterium]
MKSNQESECLVRYVQRIIIVLVLLLMLLLKAKAQGSTITISFNDELIENAIHRLDSVTGYSFAYNPSVLPKSYRITYDFTNSSVEYILSQLLKGTGLEYHKLDEQIIIKRKKNRKHYSISGFVIDAESGQTLINANVYDKFSMYGTVSNNYGYYNLTMPEGVYNLIFSFIGMESVQKQIVFDKNISMDISMSPNMELKEIVVEGTIREAMITKNSNMGNMKVNAKELAKLPAMMGDPDPVKSIQLLPGFQSGAEGNGALYVRGGGALQNLFLIDNVPIYNAYHMMGLFSVFNSDIVDKIDLYKGAFPSRYGGRLSSVLDFKTKDSNFQNYGAELSFGLLSSRVYVEGPIVKGKTSFAIAGRLGYYDLYGGNLLPEHIIGAKSINNSGFHDVNVKITHQLHNNGKLYASLYTGKDRENITSKTDEFKENYNIHRYYFVDDGQNWNNLVGTIGWAGRINSRLFGNIQLYSTTYNYKSYKIDTSFISSSFDTSYSKTEKNLYNQVHSAGIRCDFNMSLSRRFHLDFGYQYRTNLYGSSYELKDRNGWTHSIFGENIYDTVLNDIKQWPLEHMAHCELGAKVTPRLNFTLGTHISFYTNSSYENLSFQPRFSANWEIVRDVIIKAGYSMMNQNLHLLGSSRIKLASDVILGSVASLPSEESHIYSVGGSFMRFKKLKVHVEGYMKSMNNLVNLKEGQSFFTESDSWSDKYISGSGRSFGYEVMLEKPIGKFTGWIGYSWQKAFRQFESINNNQEFHFRYEHRNHLTLVAKYKFNQAWSMAATWNYHTGNRESLPVAHYWGVESLVDRRFENSHEFTNQYYYMPKNEAKNRDYHRMDVAVNYDKKYKKGSGRWTLSIYNLYNYRNVYSSTFGHQRINVIGEVNYVLRRQEEYRLFGIIPTISYTYKF